MTETLYATAVTGPAGAANATGAPDGTFTTDAGNISWTAQCEMGDPLRFARRYHPDRDRPGAEGVLESSPAPRRSTRSRCSLTAPRSATSSAAPPMSRASPGRRRTSSSPSTGPR